MTTYERGEVILVEIAYSGAPGSKRRPAVVISVDDFNRAGIKLIVAAITSNIAPPLRFGDTPLNEWQHAGLVKPSAVRGIIATVDKAEIVRKLGKLSTEDWKSVEGRIAKILGYAVPVS